MMCVFTRHLFGCYREDSASTSGNAGEELQGLAVLTRPATLRTAACVISFYWMTLNKGSRSSCDGCTRSFNRLTWTNNSPLQFRENNQKKKKEKESKCLRTHPILNLFKLPQSFLKLQYQGFIPLWSQASRADGRGQEMWPAGFNNKPYSSTEVIEKFWKYLRYIFYVYLLREESQYRTCLIKKIITSGSKQLKQQGLEYRIYN